MKVNMVRIELIQSPEALRPSGRRDWKQGSWNFRLGGVTEVASFGPKYILSSTMDAQKEMMSSGTFPDCILQ